MRRDEGEPPPWTEDPILREFRFCNVFREDDKTTQWFRQCVRDPLAEDPIRVVKATIGFRWFNRIETGERILPILRKYGWHAGQIRARLKGIYPLVTGAYMIKTPADMNKLEGIIWCMKQIHHLERLQCGNLEEAHRHLMTFPYLGAFMAYEIVTDLRHTCVLRDAADIFTWANPGPGATRGLAHIYGKKYNRNNSTDVRIMNNFMRQLLYESRFNYHWPIAWPNWDMRTVEHTLCEYDKYVRCLRTGRSKRRYAHAGD